jgi:hypothetical protein
MNMKWRLTYKIGSVLCTNDFAAKDHSEAMRYACGILLDNSWMFCSLTLRRQDYV